MSNARFAARQRGFAPAPTGGLAGAAIVLAWLAPVAGFLIGLGASPLTDVDEGAFAQATRELIASGNWGSTTLLGLPRWDKPILVYWLQALAVGVFGESSFAFRLPSALAGIAWAWVTGAFVSRVADPRRGALAALTLGCVLGAHVIGRVSTADALLNALLAAATLHAWLFVEQGDRRALRVAAACVGLGLLAKGPIALLVPGAAITLHTAIRGRWREWAGMFADPWAWALLAGIAAPWYAWQLAEHGQAFVDGFLLKHNVGRFTSTMHGFSAGPLYYPVWTLVAMLPATWVLGPVLRRLMHGPRPPAFTFGLAWCAFVLVFFSLSATKLPHYGFYGLTGLVVAAVIAWPDRTPRHAFALPVAMLLFAAAWPWLLDFARPRVTDPFYSAALVEAVGRFGNGWVAGCSALAVLVGLGGWVAAGRRRPLPASDVAWAVASVATMLVLGPGLVARTIDAIQRPVVEAAEVARAERLDVVMSGIDVPSFAVVAGTRVERRAPHPGEVVLTRTSRRADLAVVAPVDRVLYERADVSLLRLSSRVTPSIAPALGARVVPPPASSSATPSAAATAPEPSAGVPGEPVVPGAR